MVHRNLRLLLVNLFGLLLALTMRTALAGTLPAPATTRTYPGPAPCNTTIQACIDGSNAGDSINIQAGTYHESFDLNKPVSLVGADAATTILVAQPNHRVMTATVLMNDQVVVSNLTFTGGHPTDVFNLNIDGGGVFVTYLATQLRLDHVIVSGNHVDDTGGGIGTDPAVTLTIQNSLIVSNTAVTDGGGIDAGLLILQATQVVSNSAGSHGGGAQAGDARVSASRFERNVAAGGGGLFVFVGSLTDTDFLTNTAVLTSAGGGGGLKGSGIVQVVRGLFENNRVFGSGAAANLAGGGITATRFLNNAATGSAGAVLLGPNDPGSRIVNSLFAGNTSANAFAVADIYVSHGSAPPTATTVLVHDTLGGTSLNTGIGIFGTVSGLSQRIYLTDSIVVSRAMGVQGDVREDYNLYFANSTDTFANVTKGGHSLTGTNPLFVAPGLYNYHLLAGSPAINAGINAGISADFDGEPRPYGGGFDIGYDEFISYTKHLFLPLTVR